MARNDVWERAGREVGRYAAAFTKPLVWGLLVSGTAVPLLPQGGAPLVANGAFVVALAAVKPPRAGRLIELNRQGKLLRLSVATAAVVVSLATEVRPNAFLVGAVLHLAYKTLAPRALELLAVSAALTAVLATGALLANPGVVGLSGDPFTAASAFRDVVRFLLLAMIAYSATDDQRRLSELEAGREVAVADERARIARELHDVVAHHVSAMTIQAEAARSALPPGSAGAEAALAAAAREGRTAMTELRTLLGVLRGPTGEVELGPQPALDDLDDLIADLRSDGLDVRFHRTIVEGGDLPLSPALRLSAFRIVQEALANVRKHADATVVDVRITTDADAMIIEVMDDGRGSASFLSHTPGYGILGMQERAALVGGSVEARPRADGPGWQVRAILPLAPIRGVA